MAILVTADTRLVVQGITGREGSFHAIRNRDYGTAVVAGVTPGKRGQDVQGVPVYDTVAEAVELEGANAAMVFVPPRFAADAIYEAASSGVHTVICIAEGIPAHEMLDVYAFVRARGVKLLGPNCPGRALAGHRERRHHPDPRLRAWLDRARLPLGHPDLPDRQRARPGRGRQLDDRRHRRRPDRRLELHRRARAVRGRPRDRARRDGRRDRRGRGGEGGPLHRRAHAEAGRRLHRRLREAPLRARRWGTPGRSSRAPPARRRARRRRSRPAASRSARTRPRRRVSPPSGCAARSGASPGISCGHGRFRDPEPPARARGGARARRGGRAARARRGPHRGRRRAGPALARPVRAGSAHAAGLRCPPSRARERVRLAPLPHPPRRRAGGGDGAHRAPRSPAPACGCTTGRCSTASRCCSRRVGSGPCAALPG